MMLKDKGGKKGRDLIKDAVSLHSLVISIAAVMFPTVSSEQTIQELYDLPRVER